MVVNFKGKELEVSTSLRVAYELQREFDHKPYAEIFSGMGTATLQDQIRIVYTAVRIKNPGFATQVEFMDEVLDAWGMATFMEVLRGVMEGVTFNGMTPAQIEKYKAEQEKNSQTLP